MDTPSISENELDARLAAHDPVDMDALDPVEDALSVLPDVLLAHLDSPQHPVQRQRSLADRGQHGRGQPRTRSHRVLVAAAAAVILAIVFGALGVLSGGASIGLPLAVPAAQAAELNRIASVEARLGGPGKGQWLYQRYEIREGGGEGYTGHIINFHDTRTVQEWLNSTGTIDRVRTRYTSFSFDTSKDRATYERYQSQLRSGTPVKGTLTDTADPSTYINPFAAQDMPDTAAGIVKKERVLLNQAQVQQAQLDKKLPRAQQKRLAEHAGHVVFSDALFGELAHLLSTSTSNVQRAAALQAMAYVHGVQMLGSARDDIGRIGFKIQLVFPDGPLGKGRIALIVSKKTGELLQDSSEQPADPVFAAGLGDTTTIYFQQAVVDSMTALPGGDTQPFYGPPPVLGKP